MTKLGVSLACWDYDRTRPLIDARVHPDGIDLNVELLRPRQTFERVLHGDEFDAFELSLASYTALRARGEHNFIAIPVALSKIFRHSCIYVRKGAGIKKPKDLKGKRVGTTQYSATALVFMRGMLQHDYGVLPEDMHWFMGGLKAPTQRPLIALNLPEKIKLDFLSEEHTLEGMFEAGELDALLSIYIPSLFLEGAPSISRLFPNFKEVEKDYYRRTGIFPIMHTIALRQQFHDKHPWVAANLYKAFCDARDIAVEGLYDTDALRLSLPWLLDHIEETWGSFGKEFWPYGLEANRSTWQAIGRYVYEQHLAPRAITPEEMFIPGIG
jgi:4,5-dihydroxyphthalate decarboxylase